MNWIELNKRTLRGRLYDEPYRHFRKCDEKILEETKDKNNFGRKTMRSKLISAMILIFTLVAMITTAFADAPISSSVLLDTTKPTSTGISFGAVADDNKVILTAAGLSDGTNGTGIKQVDWELKFGSDVVLTKSNTYTSPITGTVSEEYTITQRGSYTLTVTLTDWVNNSQTYTKTQNLSKIGSGYLTIDSWMQGEDPKVPQFGSSTNSTTGVVVEYKLRNAADSTYTTQGPVYEVADYTARVIFPETGLYDTLTITTNFAITPFTEAPNVHILKDTKANGGTPYTVKPSGAQDRRDRRCLI